jgi:hypothetical protein
MVLMRQMKWMKKSNLNIINVDNDTDTFNNLSGQVIINHLKQDLTINNKCNIYIIDTLCENINFKMLDNSYLNVTIYMKNPNKDLNVNISQCNNSALQLTVVYLCKKDLNLNVIDNIIGCNNKSKILIKAYVEKNNLNILEQVNALKNSKENIAIESVKGLLDKGIIKVIPNMEIATSNVMANHLVSMSSFNKDYLFYFACNGINKKTAKKIIKQGFILSDLDDEIRGRI